MICPHCGKHLDDDEIVKHAQSIIGKKNKGKTGGKRPGAGRPKKAIRLCGELCGMSHLDEYGTARRCMCSLPFEHSGPHNFACLLDN